MDTFGGKPEDQERHSSFSYRGKRPEVSRRAQNQQRGHYLFAPLSLQNILIDYLIPISTFVFIPAALEPDPFAVAFVAR